MSGTLHLIKLCVGAEAVDDLIDWQKRLTARRHASGLDPRPCHVTRMWPKRAEELLDGGSLYWVFKGAVLARQSIEDLVEVTGEDGIRRCEIVLSPKVVHVETRPRRPFQGWRYLTALDAPPDITRRKDSRANIPPDLALALDGLGVIAR
jgi:hypothetical protein